MKAYKFKESEIMNIKINKSFENISDMESNKDLVEGHLFIQLDLENFNNYMSNNEILSEEIDTMTFFSEIQKSMDNVFLNDHTLNLEIEKKISGDVSRKDIMSVIQDLNDLMQEELDHVLGSELEKYINKKEEEAHYDKQIDFENEIHTRIRDRFKEEFKEDYYVFYTHTEVPSRFDVRQSITNSDGSISTTNGNFGLKRFKNDSKAKDRLGERLNKSKFVDDYYFSGSHKDVLNIKVTENAKSIFNQVAKEETEKFYKEKAYPDIEVRKYDQFVEKNSNQKGSVMDVYFNEYKREVVVVENNEQRKVGINEETNDKTLKEAINIVDNHLQEMIQKEKLKSLSSSRRRKI